MNKMLNKEDILRNNLGIFSMKLPNGHMSVVLQSLSEYAEQEAIAFAKWLLINAEALDYGGGPFYRHVEGNAYDATELYQIYKSQL